MVVIIISMVLFGYIGYLMGKARNTEILGLLLGMFLGIIGLLIMLFIPKN